ncbi:hypothetical protein ES319_A09G009600v1 [Gossypium barbadense]|uniref:Uncharacterized protein n=2 Tax=Gossypium TaxID=3633 RepID=A0A5J5U942_GOSBA|nr:hypothetical protein ES319_A09G009600v1 [Gossypium barbadense]TYH00877.1 hypothetical protein ES288_A09G011600v1 [Gossypium darwinii]
MEKVMGNPNFNNSIQSETAELKKIDEKVLQESGNDLPKTCTPRRLNLPNAFNFPERSPTDSVVSPVTRGLLARDRKAGGSLLPPSINQAKIHELRVEEIGLFSELKK